MLQPIKSCVFCRFNSIKVRLKAVVEHQQAMLEQGFNSIKVRLKVLIIVLLLGGCRCFNSIKVRLKDSARNVVVHQFSWFQFHKGAIKRILKIGNTAMSALSFNSIKVRLKDAAQSSGSRGT